MKNVVAKITKAFDVINNWVCIFFFSVLVIDVTAAVLMRYVIKKPMVWGEQLAIYCMMYIAMVGAAIAIRKGAHMGMDVLYNRTGNGMRIVMNIIIHASVVAFLLIMIILGFKHMIDVRAQRSAVLFNISMAWPHFCVPLGGVLMLIQEIGVIVNGTEKDSEDIVSG